MRTEKWLYFRNVADVDNDDGDSSTAGLNPTSICVPASAIKSIEPTLDNAVEIHWNGVKVPDDPQSHNKRYMHGATTDGVKLETAQGKAADIMQILAEKISPENMFNDGFIVVADDCVTDVDNNTITAEYIDPVAITGCGNIYMNAAVQGRGIHEYFEIVTPMTADDDDVAASLSIKIPYPSVLLEASLLSVAVAGSDHGSVALEYHNAAVNDDAASAGTEWLGAGASGATSIPNGDLDISSNATFPAIVHTGSAAKVSRTADTYLHVCAKEDMSSMTGTPQVGVYVKWFGPAAVKV